MSLIGLMKQYVKKMVTESDPGYKVMVMDKCTTSFINLVVGMTEIMKEEVYLFEQLGALNHSENMSYLKCIVYIRPTANNIALLCEELQNPRYGAYFIYFSNVISKNQIKKLAESDQHEVVQEVQEIYADFLASSPHIFSLNLPTHSIGLKWAPDVSEMCVQGITSVLFSLQLLPVIRYQNNSQMCRELGERVRQAIARDANIYEKKSQQDCVLLILDRRDDAATPLLHQWTYEAMVNELLGMDNGRVKLHHIPGISKELEEVVMIPSQDEFYAKSMYLNYGDIGQTIKDLMEEYQRKLSTRQKVESLADMKKFVENYPEFKKMSGTLSKHVTILGELSRLVAVHRLLEVSECEQELVCGYGHSDHVQRIKQLLGNPSIREKDAVKLVMLYGIRYDKHPGNELRSLVSALKKRNVSEHLLAQLSSLLDFGGSSQRQSELFETAIPQDVSSIRRRFFKEIKGVDNVYTQHKPQLVETVSSLLKGKLREGPFPYCGQAPASASDSSKLSAVVVFVIGGITPEETYAVHSLNSSSWPSVKVYLGGNHVHNSTTFLESVSRTMDVLLYANREANPWNAESPIIPGMPFKQNNSRRNKVYPWWIHQKNYNTSTEEKTIYSSPKDIRSVRVNNIVRK